METERIRRLLWIGTAVLVLIGAAAVIRRVLVLTSGAPVEANASVRQQSIFNARNARPSGGLRAFDAGFARHTTLTMIHIISGLTFLLLAPLQFVRRIRVRHPRLHRWLGRTVLGIGLIVGFSALAMSAQISIGGVSETAATMLFGCLFLIALLRGYVLILRGNVSLHRQWMMRAFAIALAVATVRPIVGIFFATSRLTGLTPHDFFGAAFWLGFTIQLIAAEAWINMTRTQRVTRTRRAEVSV